jgi:hypothetical protein
MAQKGPARAPLPWWATARSNIYSARRTPSTTPLTTSTAPYVERTAGASAAFIREVLRKAALFAADDGDRLEIAPKHLHEAPHEMLVEGRDLTKSLLGASMRAP